MHTYDAAFEIHMRTSFHPWHRAFLSHLERELQQIDPTVTVPYWRSDQKAENVFTENFIGKTEKSSATAGPSVPIFDRQNPLYSYQTLWGPLLRGYQYQNPANEKPYDQIQGQSEILSDFVVENVYDEGLNISSTQFKGWAYNEEQESHNPSHSAFTGLVSDIGKDPTDPLFFLLHGNVDRLWALWQRKYDRLSPTRTDSYPFQGKHPGHVGPQRFPRNRDKGNFSKDTLWPWDLDHDLIRPTRSWNFQNIGSGNVPQINLRFPSSPITTAPGPSPTVEDMIDHQGRLNGGITMGFDYDKIPYFDHDPIYFDDTIMASTEQNNETFLNSSLPVESRLAAAQNARLRKQDELFSLLNIVKEKDEDERIRIRSVHLVDKTKEQFLDAGIELIQDDSAPIALRSELIHSVSNAKRSNLHFPSRQPQFFNVLRGLIKSDIPLLRHPSIEILSANEDETVQEFLVEELKKDQSAFISKKDAIAFLTQNPKPQHAKLFTDTFKQSEDEEVKAAALKGLANDPNSAELLEKVVLDDQERFKVREAGALALHQINHKTMNELAAKIIATPEIEGHKIFFTSFAPDPDEVDFKAGLLNMLTFTGDINRLKRNEDLKSSLKQVIVQSADKKSNFFGSTERMDAKKMESSTIIEKMASKLLDKLEESDE